MEKREESLIWNLHNDTTAIFLKQSIHFFELLPIFLSLLLLNFVDYDNTMKLGRGYFRE